MKKIYLSCFLLWSILTCAQPKLVTALSYHGPKEGGGIFRTDLPGTSPGIIHVFDNYAPHIPAGGVCVGDNDWLYGSLRFNGTDNQGGLYRIKRDGSDFAMLHNLTTNPGTFIVPFYHADGNIYFNDYFQLKKYDPVANSVAMMPLTNNIDSRNIFIDTDSWIYYFSQFPSPALIKIKTDGTQQETLHTFNPATEGDYGLPGVTAANGNVLFGVQKLGGTNDGGTIYSIQRNGTGFTVHHQFTTATGITPESKLVYFDGKLFGTTSAGGDFGYGVLYSINEDGSNYRVLHHFNAGTGFTTPPSGNISISSNGRIFGSYQQHHTFNFISYRLFKTDTSGLDFQPFFSVNQRESGHFNLDVLLPDDETIFISTTEMGRHDGGVLSRSDTSGSGFGIFHFGYSANGFRPTAGLIKATDGKLYGAASIGSTTGNGIVFSVNENGTGYTKLHEFSDAEGYELTGKLLEAGDGKLYGVCKWGGPINTGCIFRMDKNGGNFQIVYNFPNLANGYSPNGGLVEDNTGALYGTTMYSSPGWSTVFKINKDGSNYTRLKLFDNTDIHYPFDGLALSGGYLYGSCGYGGTESKGGVFRIRTDGTGYQVLHEFSGATDGTQPMSKPVIATNGRLYGTTVNGGALGYGMIYGVDITGSNYVTLKTFTDAGDGSYPQAGVMQASDGALYGTTLLNSTGGAGGVMYKINPDGTGFATVKVFNTDTEGQGATIPLDLNGGAPLPVHWLTFTAQPVNKSVILKWQTAQEQNTRNFEIERGSNGSTFTSVGATAAAGNAVSVKSYSFTDDAPLKGINYYRLRQTDLDGKFTYSKVVTVNFTEKAGITLYPNPVHDVLYVQTSGAESILSITITDMTGKLVHQLRPGQTSFVTLHVNSLSTGIFQVQVKTTKTTYTQKITRQ